MFWFFVWGILLTFFIKKLTSINGIDSYIRIIPLIFIIAQKWRFFSFFIKKSGDCDQHCRQNDELPYAEPTFTISVSHWIFFYFLQVVLVAFKIIDDLIVAFFINYI